MDIKESFLILPIPQIELSKLITIRSVSKDPDKYILSQYSQSKIKEQFRQVKRIKGFEAKQKDLYNSTSIDQPKISIASLNIKDTHVFRVTNMRYLTNFWCSLLGTAEMSLLAKVQSVKKSRIISPSKENTSKTCTTVEISDHYFKLLPQIIKKLTANLSINSLLISYESPNVKSCMINRDPTAAIIPSFNDSLKKFYSLKKIQFKNIKNSEMLSNNVQTIVSKNKNIQDISLVFPKSQKYQSFSFGQVIQSLNPEMPLLDFFSNGEIQLSKISQNFEIIHLSVNTRINNHFKLGSFDKLKSFTMLKSLILNDYHGFSHNTLTFDTLVTLFKVLITLQNLENCDFKFQSHFSKSDNFTEIGRMLGDCKRLKSFSMDLYEQNVKGFDTISFIQNALKASQTLESANLQCYSQTHQSADYFHLNDINLNEGQCFLTIKKLTLEIFSTVSDSQNLSNLKVFLESMSNLEYLYLGIKDIKMKEDMLKTFSTGLISLQKLKYLQLILNDCTIVKISEVVCLWENINKLQELKELIFMVYNGSLEFNEPFSALSKELQTRNDNLQSLQLSFSSYLLVEPENIVKVCTECYRNLKSFCLTLSYKKITIEQASKIGYQLTNFKSLTTLVLNMNGCSLQDEGFRALIEGIGSYSKLQNLEMELCSNKLKLENIGKFLPSCYQLEVLKLNLSYNSICEKEAVELCNKIKFFYQLKNLYLNFSENKLNSNAQMLQFLHNIWNKCILCESGATE